MKVDYPIEVSLLQISFPGHSESRSPHPTFQYTARKSRHNVEFRDGNIVMTISTTASLEAGWLNRKCHCRFRFTFDRDDPDLMPAMWQQRLGSNLTVTAILHRQISWDSPHQLRQLWVEFCGLEIPRKGVHGWGQNVRYET